MTQIDTTDETNLMDDNKIKENEIVNNKITVSFYLPNELLDKIDDFIYNAKKKLPIKKRRRLTKSMFYEIGLNMAIKEFDKKGEQSELWKAICDALN